MSSTLNGVRCVPITGQSWSRIHTWDAQQSSRQECDYCCVLIFSKVIGRRSDRNGSLLPVSNNFLTFDSRGREEHRRKGPYKATVLVLPDPISGEYHVGPPFSVFGFTKERTIRVPSTCKGNPYKQMLQRHVLHQLSLHENGVSLHRNFP